MSTTRVALVTLQAFLHQLALTPPNPTPLKGRYHTDQMYILQIAPLIFKCHQIMAWMCTIFETLYYIRASILLPSSIPHVTSIVCLSTQSNIHITPIFILGFVAVMLGAYIRLDCYQTLGEMFTFDLTVHPEHKLVKSRFYSYVRHPAYTGSMLLVIGLTLTHLTEGSWLTECSPLRAPGSSIVLWALWWLWTFCVGISRADAEDKQMRKLFKEEWDAYAAVVPWWFFPGFI
ncbi:hypothetical protein BDQ12DRAFT_769472 [Crucibulum laeve]|uniref:Protein-S-isoprenylcysteine O-methyltransferase n=1 Tax=Crucibulum laeve TaxID=68775 RepID=A0A5C3LK31_9AGAR|nr:hypothetical protein BDQ12DRAFT_769472 [Crucibulum laeve]